MLPSYVSDLHLLSIDVEGRKVALPLRVAPQCQLGWQAEKDMKKKEREKERKKLKREQERAKEVCFRTHDLESS